jgi:spermidine synthase
MNIKKIYYEYDDASGISIGLEYEKYLYQCQSKYQKIEIIKTNKYGNVLYLDGCFMLSQMNQDFYHNECLNLTPRNIRKILIIGGGDFAIASMLARKESVAEITVVEIDDAVVNVSKKYFPENFKLTEKQSKKIKLVVDDGMVYLKNNKTKYETIIIDSTDPVGDAKILFSKKFIRACNDSLKKNGVLIQQSGSPLKDMDTVINPLVKIYESIGLRDVVVSSFPMPLYPTGTWSFLKAKRA